MSREQPARRAGSAREADARGGPAREAGSGDGGLDAPELLTRTATGVFRLNGRIASVAEELAKPAGITAASWQVLGAVLREPMPVAGIARAMGNTRQSVQRIADLLVDKGLATYETNPAHRRAKILVPTEEGRAAVGRIAPGHADFARRLARELGPDAFAETVRVLERLSAALGAVPAAGEAPGPASGPASAPASRSAPKRREAAGP